MVDVSHEPRWGRISEAAGEDPYLNSVMAAARVKGAQGSDYSAPDKVVTSVKHYAAYGQPEAGRDYNTTDMSRAAAVELLPAAVQGRGRRRRGHRDVLVQRDQRRARLREQVHRDRDPQAALGLRRLHRERLHRGRRAARLPAGEPRQRPVRPRRGRGRPRRRARRRSTPAPTPRWSRRTTATSAPQLVRERPGVDAPHRRRGAPHPAREVPRRAVRAPVRRPRPRPTRKQLLPAEPRRGAPGRAAARWCCSRTTATLLPLDPTQVDRGDRPARRRPARHARPVVGPGDDEDAVSLFDGHARRRTRTRRSRRAARCRNNDLYDPANECARRPASPAAVAAAQAADQVVLALGETREMSGEAEARSMLDLPGKQQELIDAVKATGKPFAVVLFNGRPLDADEVAASLAGDPRGLVPGRRGRQRASPTCCSARSTRAASCR